MKVIGITGGIASGKTTACKEFEKLGVPVYYVDDRNREIQDTEPLRSEIRAYVGESYYVDGVLDKKRLGAEVFRNSEMLRDLTRMSARYVIADLLKWLSEQTADYVLIESAVLFRTSLRGLVDYSIVVIADHNVRTKRAIERDSRTEEQIENIMSHQDSEEKMVELADFTIINGGPIEWLVSSVRVLNETLKKLE